MLECQFFGQTRFLFQTAVLLHTAHCQVTRSTCRASLRWLIRPPTPRPVANCSRATPRDTRCTRSSVSPTTPTPSQRQCESHALQILSYHDENQKKNNFLESELLKTNFDFSSLGQRAAFKSNTNRFNVCFGIVKVAIGDTIDEFKLPCQRVYYQFIIITR